MVKKLFPIIVIVLMWLLFSKPFFFENKIPYPSHFQVNHFPLWQEYSKYWVPIKNPAMPDITSQLMPWKKFTIDSYKNKEIPLWNPYSFSGTPHLANYQSAIFSPTNILFFIFSFNNAWALSILIAPLLAGIFTYLFSRSLKNSEAASIIAAVSFMFSGFIITWLSWGTLSLALSFLPFALYGIQRYFDTKKILFLLTLSLSLPVSFFSGHFQISLYFALFTFLFILFKFIETRNLKFTINSFIFFILGLLLSMPQIIPSIEFYFESYRSSIFEKIDAIPAIRMPVVVAPDFYGNAVTRNNFLGNYGEWSSFAGVIPLLLAILAIFKRNKITTFFGITAVGSLLLCIDSPIVDILVKLQIPVISTSSLSRILGLFMFSISILSAFGFDFLISKIKERNIKIISVWLFICILIFLALWGIIIGKIIDPRFYQIAAKNMILPTGIFISLLFAIFISLFKIRFLTISILIIILLTFFDMYRFANKWMPFETKEFTFDQNPIISKLTSLDNTFRFFGPFGAEGAVYYNLPVTDGYDPLYINRYGEFLGTQTKGEFSRSGRVGTNLPVGSIYARKTLDFLSIKHILLKRRDRYTAWAFPFKNFPNNKFDLIYKEKDYFIYENKNVIPRAFLVGDYQIENDKEKIMKKLLSENFDIKSTAILEKEPNIKRVKNFEGDATILKNTPNKIVIETNSKNQSILVLSDNYYPGWKVKINGNKNEIIRTNYTFRGVAVPEGKNIIEFYYSPESLKIGVYLSVLGLILMIIILFKTSYKPKTK